MMEHRSMQRYITVVINEVAVSSRVVGHFTATNRSTGCRRRLQELGDGCSYKCCLPCKNRV